MSLRIERRSRKEYLSLLGDIQTIRDQDRDKRLLKRETTHSRIVSKEIQSESADIVVFPGQYTRALHLSPPLPEAQWEYEMNKDLSQVGNPAAWAERIDRMELYRKYRKTNTEKK